jgi:hypothetical protein
MNVISAAFAVFILTALSTHPIAQSAQANQPDGAMILRRAAEHVQKVEKEWRFITAICNCPALMDEQTG